MLGYIILNKVPIPKIPIKIGEVIAPIIEHITPSNPHILLFSLKSEITPKSNAKGDKIKLIIKMPIIPITKLMIPKVAELTPILIFILESLETLIFLFESLLSVIFNHNKYHKKYNLFLQSI